MKVKLYTVGGGFVHEQRIPPLKAPPTVILWGARVFSLPTVGGTVATIAAGDDECIYEECSVWALTGGHRN